MQIRVWQNRKRSLSWSLWVAYTLKTLETLRRRCTNLKSVVGEKKIPLFFNINNIVFFQRKFSHQKKILLLVLSVGESFLTKERFSDVWKREKGKKLKVA